MKSCRKIEGLIAASLYEPLSAGEAHQLEQHMAHCPACRAEMEEMRTFVGELPQTPIEFTGDLRPALQARCEEWRMRRFPWRRSLWLSGLATCLLLFSIVTYTWRDGAVETAAPVVEVAASPMEQALILAKKNASQQYLQACQTLEDALATYPEDPRAGEAQQFLAELEFEHGQRYAESYAAYEKLRGSYWDTFRNNPENAHRLNLLSEARTDGFNALYQLAAAVNSTQDPFVELEKVVSRYPDSLVASEAIGAMERLVAQENAGGEMLRTAMLEQVRTRCSNPIAVAQLTLNLGDLYLQEQQDSVKARALYEEVMESGHMALAQAAQAAIARMDSSK